MDLNKKDFEIALSKLEKISEDTDELLGVNENIIQLMKDVVYEYNVHYKHDIEKMIDRVEQLDEKNSELEDKILRLEDK